MYLFCLFFVFYTTRTGASHWENDDMYGDFMMTGGYTVTLHMTIWFQFGSNWVPLSFQYSSTQDWNTIGTIGPDWKKIGIKLKQKCLPAPNKFRF
jgi:hypothetical protein